MPCDPERGAGVDVLRAGHRAANYHTSNREPALLTVIILARNQSVLTRACLDALACVPADLDVRLVDNASRDDTPSLAREYPVPASGGSPIAAPRATSASRQPTTAPRGSPRATRSCS